MSTIHRLCRLNAWVAIHFFGWRWILKDAEQPEAVPFLVAGFGEQGVFYPKNAADFPLQDGSHEAPSAGGLPGFSTRADAAMLVEDALLESRGSVGLELYLRTLVALMNGTKALTPDPKPGRKLSFDAEGVWLVMKATPETRCLAACLAIDKPFDDAWEVTP